MGKKSKPKIIAVVGQTATGKSGFAVELALRLRSGSSTQKINPPAGGEIISADSRQVYTGLDIGSGKITKKEMGGIPHHLLDVANPKRVFSVSDFKTLGEQAIQNILNKGKVPIICGGTGFYIDTLVNNVLLPEVPPNIILRKKLEKLSLQKLIEKLQKLDPVRAKTIDRNNPVRLIRAIEIATALGSVPILKTKSPYDVLWIGLGLPDEVLKEKIHIRLLARMKQGMLTEAKRLHTAGVSWKRMQELGLEYRFMALHLSSKISKAEMLSQLEAAIWQYAKRQKTWFKRNKEINWIDPRKKSDTQKAFKQVKVFLK